MEHNDSKHGGGGSGLPIVGRAFGRAAGMAGESAAGSSAGSGVTGGSGVAGTVGPAGAKSAAGDVEGDVAGKRQKGRAVQNTLKCNLGDVLDISSQGLRVKCMKVPKPRTEVVLTDHTRPGELFASVIWSKPCGAFHQEVGLKFEKISKAMAQKLDAIARNPRFRRAG